jgi:uncharacterized OB-fold protein
MEDFNMRKSYSLSLDYNVPLGVKYSVFMEGLKNKKIMGNKCDKCGRNYVPVRPFCDICCEDTTEPIEVDQTGVVVSYTVYCVDSLDLPDPPFAQAVIKIGDAANSFIHYMGGIAFNDAEDLKNKIKVGMKVEPVWADKPTGDILDIKYFKPV